MANANLLAIAIYYMKKIQGSRRGTDPTIIIITNLLHEQEERLRCSTKHDAAIGDNEDKKVEKIVVFLC